MACCMGACISKMMSGIATDCLWLFLSKCATIAGKTAIGSWHLQAKSNNGTINTDLFACTRCMIGGFPARMSPVVQCCNQHRFGFEHG